jgi:hypothetical protein
MTRRKPPLQLRPQPLRLFTSVPPILRCFPCAGFRFLDGKLCTRCAGTGVAAIPFDELVRKCS